MARRRTGSRPYRRTARVNELVREIVAEELQVIGDERLELVTITGVVVDAELRTGTVYFDTPWADAADDAVVAEALESHRVRLQRAIGDQARMRRTPELTFRPDEGIRAGLRVESILRDLGPADGGTPADGETPADSSDAPADGSAGGERSGPGPGDPT
jgi:ribosome-binding factor A